MKRFRFRLQALLAYRRYRERLAQQETALALRAVRSSEERVAALRVELGQSVRRLDARTSGGIAASEYKAFAGYLESLEDDIGRQVLKTRSLEADLIQKQKILTQRSVDRKVMDRLKEKQGEAYLSAFLKLEQKTLDEITSLRKAREITDGTQD
jgi:flagellar FliJ protein